MRAVASVAPYMTNSDTPCASHRSTQVDTRAGCIRPPAWVRKRRLGTNTDEPARSISSNVCGTPAMLVTPWRASSGTNPGSTTDRPLRTIDAPARRWLWSTERP
ncbi:unannotated protein [freshwater metagenome]|uniref:Unannotated protein n=1 Tax=freshwater metagenome TaxID=449393 RepID=A0A6J6FW33_9ZZZZ